MPLIKLVLMNDLNPESNDSDSFWKSLQYNLNLQIGLFVLVWLGCSLFAAFLTKGIGAVAGVTDFQLLIDGLKEGLYFEHVNTLKFVSIIGHLFQYLVPVLLFSWLVYKNKAPTSLFANKKPKLINILLCILILVALFPFISYLYYWNTILLPDSLISKDTLILQKIMLEMNRPADLCLNLFLFGFVAGIGEEFFFRGVLQRLFTEWIKNIHFSAILTGFFFSFIHFQLEGFLPRFILGVLFCYLLVYTGNLWITVVIHILFNSVQVVIPYFFPEIAGSVDKVQQISPFIAGLSLFVFIVFFSIFRKYNSRFDIKYYN